MISRTNLLPHLSVLVILAACLRAAEAKKFVVLVGPHETHTGTTSFLSEYAADDGSGASSFDGWSWPIIENLDEDVDPQHAFGLIVKEQSNDDIQDILIDGIRSAWTASEKGIFIGSLDFDKVGTNPYSGYDAVKALTKVVDEIGISAEDIQVIVTYATPRANQWKLVWKNHFSAESYDEFVCSSENSDKRWEWLDTSMNPFKIAKAYHDQKWNVVMVDQNSILKAGKDVANVVACLAMENENCENGLVDGLEQMIPKTSLTDEIDDLGTGDRNDLERLFLFRDCYYVEQLKGSANFEMYEESSAFDAIKTECNSSLQNSYTKLSDTNFFMNAIQSQKYCETDDIDVPSFLSEISESGTDKSTTYDDFVETYESEDDGAESDDGDKIEEIDENEDEDESSIDTVSNDEVEKAYYSSGDDKKDSVSSSFYTSSNKKLIVFVGPHETEAVDVLKFFVNYASTNDDYDRSDSFDGWSWPLVEDEIIWKPPHRAFDLLVTEPNEEDVQKVLIDAITEVWEKSTNGVIIGSLDFDWVGSNPYSHYDPKGALHRVVDALGISNEDVILALTYRSPRIDHWSVVWNNHFDSLDYEQFICSDGDESEKRWEWLDTVMNPFKVAESYHDEGWNVAVIDQDGTLNAGMDVSHVIACKLMEGVKCKNGWVEGLEDITSDPVSIIPMSSMDEDDRRNLEQLFRERDCHFKYELKDKPGFEILNQRSTWSSCSLQHKTFYQQFTDTNFMLNLLKSQKKCEGSNIDVSDMLEKKMVHDGNKKLIIFAGPHETSAIPLNKFFVEHASDLEGTNRSTSLEGWTWPIIESEILGDTQSHRTFDLLLSDADTRPVQNIIMDGIRDSWNEAYNGVIIGSLDLDRIGKNPYSSYDALGAVYRVVQTLGISDNDVTVVLNYRSRRLDHLSAVWWNHFDAESFQEFICSDDESDKRWEWIDTVMNPLKLANAYVEEGWNVAMIDQEGTTTLGKDIAHVVSCDLMNDVDCDNGWVRGLEGERIVDPTAYEIDDLDVIQRTKFETLFCMRDCIYKNILEADNRFSTVNRKDLWNSCSSNDKEEMEKLADTDFLLEVMKTLLGCGDKSNLESTVFASEILESNVKFVSRNHSTLIIATVFLSAITLILSLLLMNEMRKNKNKKSRKTPTDGVFRDHPTNSRKIPTEGVFRDDPSNIDVGRSPYSDNEVTLEDSVDERHFGGDDEVNDIETLVENLSDERELRDVEDIGPESLPSDEVNNCGLP
mmetsp:Transcript_4639/g.11901  ORF Transcript_4639/g.11901 Transcript_4639/m.11901 type:complete len:1238 (-) Transcript_4639:491-4204(-)|eukprot:CAMPEP_0197194116 /NCGR_PEP_ID=MMETSP1423-20130617/28684_1 /TAXON_ID=476441 /ORGANISM="Pseudo-nitzschia heimii, Strain UNC1101" /LENGTH=1237 /DNA_ID=CAMNT_0042647487 /DNA_START=55 /DNA_END=3768 /DNA_ORIENTATION=-